MVCAILSSIPFINAPLAAAADSYAIPECSGGWNKKDVEGKDDNLFWTTVQGFAVDTGIPGMPFDTEDVSTTETCVDQGLRLTFAPRGEIYTMFKVDGGVRVWGEKLNGSYKASSLLAGNPVLQPVRTNELGGQYRMNSSSAYQYYFISVINGATIDQDSDGKLKLNAQKPSVVYQVAKAPLSAINTVMPVLNANGGAFSNANPIATPMMEPSGLNLWTTQNKPTRNGYTFKQWTTDLEGKKPFESNTSLADATHLYAQWAKDSGTPQKVDLDCSTGGRCELTVNYADSIAKTREFYPGTANLAWSGTPITGVRLDAAGYAADGACSDTRCWYVSLENAPQNPSAYQAQMPTTGAPEGLSTVGATAVGLGLTGLLLAMVRRRTIIA